MTPLSLSRRDKGVVFAAALAARLAATAWLGFGGHRFGDAAAYQRAAGALWSTGTYPTRTDPFLLRPPGYPAFLAISTWGHPDWIVFDKVVNAVLGALAVVVLASLALRVLRSLRSARIAAALAVVNPSFLLLSSDVRSESLFLLLLLVAGFLSLVAVDRPSSGCGILAGVALALAALTRPSALALTPLLAAPTFDRRFPPAIRRVLAGSACFGFVVALAPWTIRNAVRFHALIPVRDGGGLVFYHGHSWIRAHTREELGMIASRSGQWLRPGANPHAWPKMVVRASAAWYLALASLAAFGMSRSERRGVLALALATLVISFGVHVATLGSVRSRAVYWDPVLILYAAAAISSVAGRRPAA